MDRRTTSHRDPKPTAAEPGKSLVVPLPNRHLPVFSERRREKPVSRDLPAVKGVSLFFALLAPAILCRAFDNEEWLK